MFTLNNQFFRHQACYSLLPAKPGGQADCVISLCKYKVVGMSREKGLVHTVIRFVYASAKFGICTIVGLNGILVEDKMPTC